MIRTATIKLPKISVKAESLGYFRFGHIGGKILLTNDAGEWHFLSEADFSLLLAGKLTDGHPEWRALAEKCMVRGGADLDWMASKVRRKKAFLNIGPHLHGVITTLRFNQYCKYCHASRT